MFDNGYYVQIFFAECLGVLSVSWLVFKKTNWYGAIFFTFAMVMALYRYHWPQILIPELGPIVRATMGSLSASAAVFVLTIVLFFLVMRDDLVEWFYEIFAWIGAGSAIWIIGQFIAGNKASSFMLNEAQDGTLLACMLPLVLFSQRRLKWAFIALYVAAIFVTRASTPLMGFGLAVFSYLWFSKRRMLAIAAGPVIFTIAYLYLGQFELFHNNGRLELWTLAIDFYQTKVNRFIGAGLGSYFFYGPGIQFTQNKLVSQNLIYIWLHNDWFQILFELGAIGSILSVLFYFSCLMESFKKPAIFCCLLIFGITDLTQMHLHQFMSAMFICWLCRTSFVKLPEND